MAQIKERYDICIAETYQSNGETKRSWHKIGEGVVWDDGSVVEKDYATSTVRRWFSKKTDGVTETSTKTTSETQEKGGDMPF